LEGCIQKEEQPEDIDREEGDHLDEGRGLPEVEANAHMSAGLSSVNMHPFPYCYLAQAVHKFAHPKFVANFDESPVAFNGEITKYIVVQDTETDLRFDSRGSEDSKRMFTYAMHSQAHD
jgi:hypothetical protein